MRLLLIFSLIGLLSCRQESAPLPDADSTIISVQNQPSWQTKALDDTYLIQFPGSYKGGIGPTIEGPEFSLNRNDQRAYFLAPLPFMAGQELLATPLPDNIQYANLTLDKKVYFQRDNQTQGIFYYAPHPKGQGKLYLLQNGRLTFNMIIQYDADLHREVLGILQTVRPR